MTRRVGTTLLVALALTLGGCIDIGGRTPPSRQLLLRGTGAVAVPLGQTPPGSPTVGVPPVTIPAYLDRPQLVWRTGPDELTFGAAGRWAEPLQAGVARVLAEDLQRWWPQAWVQPGDPPLGTGRRLSLRLNLTRFEGGEDGSVHLEGNWQLAAVEGGEVLAEGRVRRVSDWSGAELELPEALSRLLAEWARELAPVLQSVAEGRGGNHAPH